MNLRLLILVTSLFGLSGCEQVMQRLGLEDPAAKEERLESDAKAVGGACRHSGRAIEDCYAIYSWLPRAGIFAGWREMDAYMRENEIASVEPQLPPPEPPNARKTRKKKTEEPAAETEPAKAAAEPSAAPDTHSDKK